MRATVCDVCHTVATESIDVRSANDRRTSMIDTRIDLCDDHAFEVVDGMLARIEELRRERAAAAAAV